MYSPMDAWNIPTYQPPEALPEYLKREAVEDRYLGGVWEPPGENDEEL
jgi:hypothetical protein